MLATFCLLSIVNPLTNPPSYDPILINMNQVSIVKPRLKKTQKQGAENPSMILMGGMQYVVRESVQQIHDKCLK